MIRFKKLNGDGILPNRPTARRWIEAGNFPRPIKLGPNSIAWLETDIVKWLAERKAVSLQVTE